MKIFEICLIIIVCLAILPAIIRNFFVWARAGFYTPIYVHISAVCIFAVFGINSKSLSILTGPVIIFVGALPYLLYSAFGHHFARSMCRCTKGHVGRWMDKAEALEVLREQLKPYKEKSRKELVRLFQRHEKFSTNISSSTTDHKYRFECEVLASIYYWEGANLDHLKKLEEWVHNGGAIKVVGRLVSVDKAFLWFQPTACLSFQMDGEGVISTDGTTTSIED